MVVVCGNTLSASQQGEKITIDIKAGNRPGLGPQFITKTLWTCCVEAVMEYCRVMFDLFPDEYQVTIQCIVI